MQDSNDDNSPLSLEERERIRIKRLEKLQGLVDAQKSQEGASPTSSSSPATSNSPRQPAPTQVTQPKQQQIKPTTPTGVKPVPQPVAAQSPKQPALSFEAWQNVALSKILFVSLNEQSTSPMLFLSGLYLERIEEQAPLTIELANLEEVIFTRMATDPNDEENSSLLGMGELSLPLFDYFLNCWRRLVDVRAQTLKARSLPQSVIEERVNLLNKAREILVTYACLMIQEPELYPQVASTVQPGPQQLVVRMLHDPDSREGLPIDFLRDIAKGPKDTLEFITHGVVSGLGAKMRVAKAMTDWRSPMNALQILVEIPELAAAVTTHPLWNPTNATAPQIELVSALGPFFRISGFLTDDPTLADMFGKGVERTREEATINFGALRAIGTSCQKSLFQITNLIIRSSPVAREKVIQYFFSILTKNATRGRLQVDRTTVSGDGFMFNITEVLLQLCDPIMENNYSRIDKIAHNYFQTNPLVDIAGETRICASKEVVDAYASQASPTKTSNFVSDIFFASLLFHHFGVLRSFVQFKDSSRDLHEYKEAYTRLKEQEAAGQLPPQQAIMIQRYEAEIEKLTTFRMSLEAQVLNPALLQHAMQFYNLVMVWLVRLVDPTHAHPRVPLRLPLPETPPSDFAILPEYIFEDIVEFFIFVLSHKPNLLVNSTMDELINFSMVFLAAPGYIKNPHLKSKLVQIIYHLTPAPRDRDVLGVKLHINPMAVEHLIPSIMRYYVEAENTGRHSQFYDKFNIRYNISQILKYVWNNPVHREKFKEESKKSESFVRFANLLMNDTTYLLDEGLSKLVEINQIELEKADTATWNAQSPQQQQEREGILRTAQRQASSFVSLGNETVHMLSYLTVEVKEPFLTPEIVDRLATMLNYNLVNLVGNKMSNLKVKNPERYQFQPRVLLSEIIDIYLHLDGPLFVAAIARDGRSYSKGIFTKAEAILLNRGLKSEDEIRHLVRLVDKVESVRQQEVDEEEELGEVPDEFLDPLLYTLMEDPVILPTSNISVDRSTIKSHLLSDANDPFNRKPLKIQDVVDDVELKEKITAWKVAQREAKKAAKAAAAAVVPTDMEVDN